MEDSDLGRAYASYARGGGGESSSTLPQWKQRGEGTVGRLDEADILSGLAEYTKDTWGAGGNYLFPCFHAWDGDGDGDGGGGGCRVCIVRVL
jgi:hypothetical protein